MVVAVIKMYCVNRNITKQIKSADKKQWALFVPHKLYPTIFSRLFAALVRQAKLDASCRVQVPVG